MSDPAASQPKLSRTQSVETAEVTVGEEVVLPLIEETARIDKQAVETGRVRVSTRTETVDQVLRESLRSQTVEVNRVPVNRTLSKGEVPPVIREENGVTVIPVLEEILVVEKRLVLKEEVHVRRSSADEDVEVPVTLRKQRAVVERVSPDGHASEQIDPPSTQETTP
ncbi:YsnF/AvaK domain-containing protein [Methylobacterium sp. J-072]|uniref:YsnF/AvaK domain-containing protein n=1 Tax=Methylobacterium sp. J-072 TaxID=2836651 RepID=UPI001FBA65EC|nr:YsnF/AvaK domain-containing protein [Methylobacterium sp. J-072]MCJ2093002.1 YsnF/AvaK domain-containing protein [Methylobacterium sp. J-072]